jgi:hypothetical protein
MSAQIDLSGLENHPGKVIGTLLGLAVGLGLPSGLEYFLQLDSAMIAQNPEAVIIGLPIALLTEAITGFVGAFIGLIIGTIVDSLN